ncbi:unnamed protein product [marine sediment metagenome]|uniref:Integrase catalytic domain-containing protein n=1 Tax=marine sediment metagenome TaxID=412755 RepID=X1JAY5_9ZZZZ
MAKQLHKRFSAEEVKALFRKYLYEGIELIYILETLKIKKSRFFNLLKEYMRDPNNFSLKYKRKSATRRISADVERSIINELKEEKKLIQDKDISVTSYNYSYVKDRIYENYKQKVSLPTIINRAKKEGFYKPKKRKKKSHDREVRSNYIGELIQHDSSHHKFSPYADKKWYLTTSLDDYSRLLLYAKLIEKETSWQHILALQDVFLVWGFPFSYYVDSHSIFRFVQGRDSLWRKHYLVTDEVDTQWKMVLDECKVKAIYALSPQARGKIERPYRWLQDRIVRTCAREGIEAIQQGREVLENEIKRYNYRQVHSTTGEIPILRFERAMKEKKSLFREFKIPSPYTSIKDIFCLRVKRIVDAYHKISLDKLTFKVHKAPLRKEVQLRITPDKNTGLTEIRIWYKDILTDVYQVKNSDLNSVHF